MSDTARRLGAFDLTTVQLFIATAETGSVTRAAERLHLAPSAASRRLKELEQHFNVALLQRLPHGMALTDAGRALLGHARSMLQSVSRMHHDAQAFIDGDRGVVRIAACTSAVLQFLPRDLLRCHRAYPDIRIDLREFNSSGVLQAVNRGLVDIGIFESSFGPVELACVPYHEDRLVLVVPRAHALAARKRVGVADIAKHDLIGLTEGSAITTTLERVAADANLRLRMRILVGSFASMMAMVDQGLGIGVMPERVATTFGHKRGFVCVPIAESWAQRSFTLCHQADATLSVAARSVIGVLGSDLPKRAI